MKVSVITPIYNTEKYLDKCLTSLVNQTLADLELIWVDNGSNEECWQIIEKYSLKRPSIKVIHLKENIGYGGAMNAGLEIATGEYIGFCDSDDWVDEDYYEKLYLKAKETNADIAYTCYKEEFDKYEKTILHRVSVSLIANNAQKIYALLNGAVWNKIFKREVIVKNQIRFPVFNHSYALDNAFLLQAVVASHQMALVNEPYYHYVQHQESVMYTTPVSAEKIRQISEWIISKINNKNLSSQDKYEIISFFVRSIGLEKVVKNKKEYASLKHTLADDEEFIAILEKYRKDLLPSFRQKLFSVQNCFNKRVFWILGIKIKQKRGIL